MARVRVFPDLDALSRHAADLFCELSAGAISARGAFRVALPGGSTPKRLYSLLASEGYRRRVDWPRVECFFGDERCVPREHAGSNFRAAWEGLLSKVDARVHRVEGEREPEEAALRYETELREAFGPSGPPVFDLMLLGIGADGHTASLFPGSGALRETGRLSVAVRAEGPGTWRVTLTLPVINAARSVVFLAAGALKAGAVGDVLAGNEKSARLPAALVRPALGEALWLLDEAAASALPGRLRERSRP